MWDGKIRRAGGRVRPTLLVLLWIWAVCVFVVVDLFFNAAELDAVRPRWTFYRGMRIAAHKMVGAPYREDFAQRNPRLREGRPSREARDASPERSAVLRGLTRLAAPELVEIAMDPTQEVRVRQRAARLVGRSGPDALPMLQQLVAAGAPGAALGLPEVGGATAARLALELARGSVRSEALRAIGGFSDPAALEALLHAAADRSVDGEIRVAACRMLDLLESPACAGILGRIADAPDSPQELRDVARDTLVRIALREVRAMESAADLRRAAVEGIDARVRVAALHGLSGLRADGRDALLRSARDPKEDRRVREQAARMLGSTGPDALPLLLDIIGSELDAEVRAAAVQGLGAIDGAAAAERALELTKSPAPRIRSAAIQVVSTLADPNALPFVLEAALDETRAAETREAACRALGLSRDGDATLARLLQDRDSRPALRRAAVEGLARSDDPAAREAVAAACRDADPEVARLARRIERGRR